MIHVYLLICNQLMNILCKATVSALAKHIFKKVKSTKKKKSKRLSLVTAWGTYCCVQTVYILHTHTELPGGDEKERVTFKFQAEDVPSSTIWVGRKLLSALGAQSWNNYASVTLIEVNENHQHGSFLLAQGVSWWDNVGFWPISLIIQLSKCGKYL